MLHTLGKLVTFLTPAHYIKYALRNNGQVNVQCSILLTDKQTTEMLITSFAKVTIVNLL